MDVTPMRSLVAVVLVLCVGQAASNCPDNTPECDTQLRERLLDNNHFWFGTLYADQCPGSVFCVNELPNLKSVLSRVMVTEDSTALSAAVANIKFLNVTFLQPARNYFACDATIVVPAGEPKTINPVEPANLSERTVHTPPHVTWTPKDNETLYTFLLLDSSFIYLHTMFVNCRGGNTENCEVARPWLGSSVPMLVNSGYTFMVYEQTQEIPVETAKAQIAAVVNEGAALTSSPLGRFYLHSLFDKLKDHYTIETYGTRKFPAIKFATIMEMYPDPWGSYQVGDLFGTIDLCPLFFSQIQAFHTVVEVLQVPNANWSSPAFGYSQVAVNPSLLSIDINMHINYITEEFSDTACCTKFHQSRGMYIISPLDRHEVNAASTRSRPDVFLTPLFKTHGRFSIAFEFYTMVAVNVANVVANPNNIGAPVDVHWLVANIVLSDFVTGKDLVDYAPPAPSADKPVTLMFLLFTHEKPLNPANLTQVCPEAPSTCRMNMSDFISTTGMGDIVAVNWFTSKEDGYSRKLQYTNMGMSEQQVCDGIDGYSSPCSEQQRCSALGQISFRQPYLIGQLAALALVFNYIKAMWSH